MFSKLLCIVNISSYKKEQLKLHQSFLGVKGGGAKTALYMNFSIQHIAVTLKIIISRPNFLLKVRQTQQILFENVHKYCPFLF